MLQCGPNSTQPRAAAEEEVDAPGIDVDADVAEVEEDDGVDVAEVRRAGAVQGWVLNTAGW